VVILREADFLRFLGELFTVLILYMCLFQKLLLAELFTVKVGKSSP